MRDDGPERKTSRLSGRLGVRLAALLALALLPLGLISVLQSRSLIDEARGQSEAALMGETLHASAREIALIQRGQGVAQSLTASFAVIQKDPAACIAALRSLVEQSQGAFSLVGIIPVAGVMTCSSAGKTVDYSTSERFINLVRDPRKMMTVLPNAKLSGRPVLSISHPAYRAGELAGFVVVSIPQATLTVELAKTDVPWGTRPLSLMTFDNDGHVLTASGGLNTAEMLLPAGRDLKSLASDRPVAFTSRAADGADRTFSVVPLIPGTLYAIGTWPDDQTSLPGNLAGIGPIISPLLMCAASLIIAWMAAEHLVTRYVRALRRSITSFAGGNRTVEELRFSRAPTEIREVAEAYEQMTESILHDEAELEDVIHQKEVLLREVHHRVKNNLQLIASMMNMQQRLAHSQETREMIKTLQDRVMSLATIHRGLYQTSGLTDIRADELLPDILRQVLKMGSGPGRRFDVQSSFADVRLTPDQAVPLSLLLTEALTNAMKYASPEADGAARLNVVLEQADGGRATMRVENTSAPPEADILAPRSNGTGLGTQLMNAFAQQLGTRIVRSRSDNWFRMAITFAVRPLADAEARHAAPAEEEV
jgi:two-component sensor histidine kinase